MKSCCIVPHEFIIFCWLPAVSIHRNRMRSAKALVLQLQSNGWPFRLRFEVPDDPQSLFPSRFASSCKPHLKKLSQADLSDFNPMDFEEEEDPIDWDIFALEEVDELNEEDRMHETETSQAEDDEHDFVEEEVEEDEEDLADEEEAF